MKYRFNPRALKAPFLVLAATLALQAEVAVAKDYVRACQGEFHVAVKALNGARLRSPAFPRFTGKGKVGVYAPKKARERARTNIEECVRKAWEKRHVASKPSECSESNLIYNYPFSSGLHPAITIAVCRLNPGHESLLIDLTYSTSGERGCYERGRVFPRSLTTNYHIRCPSSNDVLH